MWTGRLSRLGFKTDCCEPHPRSDAKSPPKQDAVIAMLRRAEGATVNEVVSATGWQRHTVRGVSGREPCRVTRVSQRCRASW